MPGATRAPRARRRARRGTDRRRGTERQICGRGAGRVFPRAGVVFSRVRYKSTPRRDAGFFRQRDEMPTRELKTLDSETAAEYAVGYDWIPGKFGPPPGIDKLQKDKMGRR